MDRRLLRRVAERALVVGVIVVAPWTEVAALLPVPATSIAEASVAADRHDDGKDKKDSKKKDDDRGEDFVLNGQVLEIDTHKDPPEMVVGTVDGRARVRVLKTDEIAKNGVRIGDSVELTGEKINEQLFEATEISVSEHAGGPSADDAGHDDDNDNSSDEDVPADEPDSP
jgi:hypothetical protein